MAGKKNTVSAVFEIVSPIAEKMGLFLWDIRFVKEGSDKYLRIFIDKEEGVSIDDCVALTRALNDPLDEADLIDGAYILEVSSPGVERELRKDEHFLKYIGSDIKVKMIRPIEGIGKEFAGVLEKYGDKKFTIVDYSGENRMEINIKDTAFVKLDDFDN
ncbi:MAG: ribosome maturation factor RimP [Acutalibacteraceae bacterium]